MGCYIYVLYGIELLKGKTLEDAYKEIQAKNYSYFSTACIERYNRILNEDISKLLNKLKTTKSAKDVFFPQTQDLVSFEVNGKEILKGVNYGK